MIGDPCRNLPQYTRFEILAWFGNGLRRCGIPLAKHRTPCERCAAIEASPRGGALVTERAEWPPMETLPVPGPPPVPTLVDADQVNSCTRVVAGLGAKVILVSNSPGARRFSIKQRIAGKLRLRLADGRAVDVVAKCARPGLEQEARFYEELAPQVRVDVPRFYGLVPPVEGQGPNWILLEALPAGRRPASWMADDLRAAVKALAALHAQFWDQPLASRYGWLPVATDSAPDRLWSRLAPALEALWSHQCSYRRFPRLLSKEIKVGIERIAHDLEPALRPLRALPQTLLHGDPSLHNFLIGREGESGNRTSVIDFEKVCQGPAILDLVNLYDAQLFRFERHYRSVKSSEPLLEWRDMLEYYFDALEHQLGAPIDRCAQVGAAPAAELNLIVRQWLTHAGLVVSTGDLDFLVGRLGRLFRPLALWADLPGFLDQFANRPLRRLEQVAPIIYGSNIFAQT